MRIDIDFPQVIALGGMWATPILALAGAMWRRRNTIGKRLDDLEKKNTEQHNLNHAALVDFSATVSGNYVLKRDFDDSVRAIRADIRGVHERIDRIGDRRWREC